VSAQALCKSEHGEGLLVREKSSTRVSRITLGRTHEKRRKKPRAAFLKAAWGSEKRGRGKQLPITQIAMLENGSRIKAWKGKNDPNERTSARVGGESRGKKQDQGQRGRSPARSRAKVKRIGEEGEGEKGPKCGSDSKVKD